MSVVPTRMELAKLKKRLKAAREGHKLQKDKQDELMRAFIASLNAAGELRVAVDQSMRSLAEEAELAAACFPKQMVKNAFLVREPLVEAEIEPAKWMGVSLVRISYDTRSAKMPSALVSSPQLMKTAREMQALLPRLLDLAIAEKNCALLAAEIEMLRRRVNALEHRVIPELEANIRTITMKLSDHERDTVTRLIKMKHTD